MRKNIATIIILLQFLLLSACSDLFEYSTFDTNIKTHDLNKINSAKISDELLSVSDTLKLVMFSDTQDNYDDMSDAIGSINKLSGISFVVCCGDITNSGLIQEFEWYADVAKESRYPPNYCNGKP